MIEKNRIPGSTDRIQSASSVHPLTGIGRTHRIARPRHRVPKSRGGGGMEDEEREEEGRISLRESSPSVGWDAPASARHTLGIASIVSELN